MEKKNFISKEQVKKLVEDEYFYGINIPMQFYTKDTKSGKYILQEDTAEFQDFLEKAKEEVYYQGYGGNEGGLDLEDIIINYYFDTAGIGKLDFSTYDENLGDLLYYDTEKIIHTVRIYLPQPLKNKGENDKEFQEFVEKMTDAVVDEYAKNTDTATVDWKLSENEYGEKVIEFEVVEEE